LPLNGASAMEGNLDMGDNKIENVALPGTDGTAAANKNYVDDNTAAFAQISQKRDLDITGTPGEGDLLAYSGNKVIFTNAESGGTISNGDTITGSPSGATGTVVDITSVTDEILGSQRKIVYTPVSGTFNTSTDSISNGVANATIATDAPSVMDDIVQAGEDSASDINVSINRTASSVTYDLQIEAGAIVNADVNASAAIAQSKLNMQAADTSASAPGSFDQSVLGLARFDSDDFDVTHGWVTLKDNEVDFGDLPQLDQYEAIGRVSSGTGDTNAISFADIITNGGGLADADFTSVRAYFDSDGVTRLDPGNALIEVAAGSYAKSDISYTSTGNSIAKRNNDGDIMANALILGGTETNVVMDVSGSNVRVKTPDGEIIMQASGTGDDNTIINKLPTSIDNGTTGITTESDLQGGATNLNDRPFLATEYIYANMIESHGTITAGKPGGGAAIGLGSDPGFTNSGTNVVTIATGGTERVYVNNTNTVITNTLKANGNVDLGDAGTDTISFNGVIDTNVIPDATANNRDLGSSSKTWNVIYGKATSAQYADLAENYLGDANYEPGTVLVFGGEFEVTTTDNKGDTRVAGVVTTNPAHLMNSTLEGDNVIGVALTGRVPCKVIGRVRKGDLIVTSAIPGYGIVDNTPGVGQIIGKALEDKDSDGRDVIEVVVGRV